jgi:predicted phage terminase large subunit-like protein
MDKKAENRIRHICLPAEDSFEIKPARLKDYYVEGLMDPRRCSYEVLREARDKLGEFGYAGQYGQHPVPIGGGMFKWERIHIGEIPPINYVYVMRYWDKAGSTTKKAAWTVGVKMAKDVRGRFWVLDVIRGRWESAQREAIIKATAVLDGRKVLIGVEQEPGSGGKESAENTVKMLAGWRVRVDIPKGDKVLRADPFSVQVNAGNVCLAPGEWNTPFLKEIEFFPYSKYKDQVDACSGAFSFVSKGKVRVGGLKKHS